MEKSYNPFSSHFILCIHPNDCASKAEFDKNRVANYRYILLGGNHSFLAKKKLAAKFPRDIESNTLYAQVLVGCSVAEMRKIAWADNVDAESRKNMSTAERIIYIHNRDMECDRPGASDKPYVPGARLRFKMMIAGEIALKGWGIAPDKDVLQAQDNLF